MRTIKTAVANTNDAVDAAPKKKVRRTELGIAEEFARECSDVVRYCRERGGWHAFNGKFWEPDLGAAERHAKRTIRSLWTLLPEMDGNKRVDLARLLTRCETAHGLSSVMRLASGDERIEVRANAFDADPWILNCTNGTVDLRTLELRAHNPDDLLTHCTASAFDPAAKSELWDRVLLEACGGDVEIVEFIARAYGYFLTGLTTEEKLFLVIGPGGSAKSTIVESFKNALGTYARTANFDTFLKNARSGAREDIARLAGARLVTAIEAPKGARLDESLMKSITGGDVVAARFLYGGTFEYRPQFKLALVANDAPRVSDDDSGMWRRIVRLPFEHAIPRDRRDPKIKLALMDAAESGAAILAWAVRGLIAWREHGLGTAKRIEQATNDYRADMDPLADFFGENVIFEAGARCTRTTIFKCYERWNKEAGGRFPLTPKSFAERLRARGATEGKSRGERVWLGVRLGEGTEEADDIANMTFEELLSSPSDGEGASGADVQGGTSCPSKTPSEGTWGHQDPELHHTRACEKSSRSRCPHVPSCPPGEVDQQIESHAKRATSARPPARASGVVGPPHLGVKNGKARRSRTTSVPSTSPRPTEAPKLAERRAAGPVGVEIGATGEPSKSRRRITSPTLARANKGDRRSTNCLGAIVETRGLS